MFAPAYTRISCRAPGVDELHAAFLKESRTRTRRWRPMQEIRDHGPKTMFSQCPHSTATLLLGCLAQRQECSPHEITRYTRGSGAGGSALTAKHWFSVATTDGRRASSST
jgi:hypothetical protein